MDEIIEFLIELVASIFFEHAVVSAVLTTIGLGIVAYAFWPLGGDTVTASKIVGVILIVGGLLAFYGVWRMNRSSRRP
ncbi:hypothetical protein RPMA_02235 [Tardiphaga alba]|uniref:Uncharacterized protein n=1 Tax=Tardiphaga alba TaxID=340268 RepID=A0ABX8A2V1_9BRAD|nr:hypothetical protein [Tardiphaga alba]QUS37813.1 hypothetical protein RPMA_02235 [Tardiphaga alba]